MTREPHQVDLLLQWALAINMAAGVFWFLCRTRVDAFRTAY